MIKLNLGCSNNIKENYLNIDLYSTDSRVKLADVRNLNFIENNSVSEIIAHDILEHIPFNQSSTTIKEWCRVLNVGGVISIQTTNLTEHIEAFLNNKWDISKLNYMLFAGIGWTDGTSRDHDWHKSIYTTDYVCSELEKNSLKIISKKYDSHKDTTNGNLNFTILGQKHG